MDPTARPALAVQRAILRGHAANLLDQATILLQEGPNADLETLTNCHGKLLDVQPKLEAIDGRIFGITDAATIEDDVTDAVQFQLRISDVIVELSTRCKQVESQANAANAPSPSARQERQSFQSQSATKVSTKLPKLTILKFGGNPLKWRQFWDSFESAIHLNNTLSNVDKFNYLRSLLEGDADRSINGLAITNANYNIAVDTIRERFGNEQTVVFAHFEQLFRLPMAAREMAKLRYVYDECELHIRGLEAMGITEDKFGVVFIPLLLSKLPEDIRIDLNRKNGCQNWELSQLRKLLKEEILTRELGEQSCNKQLFYDNKGAHHFSRFKPVPVGGGGGTSGALASNSNSAVQAKKPITCIFCGNSHYSDECTTYSDLESRLRKAKDRCLGCSRTGHYRANCPRPSICVYCQKRHHRCFCPQRFGKGTVPTALAFQNDSNTCSPGSSAEPAMLTVGHRVLMQTATTIACNGSLNAETRIRILLDTGSQRSYIAKTASERLRLTPDSYEVIHIATFGSTKAKKTRLPVVNLQLRTIDGSYVGITANEIPTITSPIIREATNLSQYKILTELPLAEPVSVSNETVTIDLLVGMDYYYDFVLCERIMLANGLYLINSKFGWIISGRTDESKADSVTQAMLIWNKSSDSDFQSTVERFWRLDCIGIDHDGVRRDDDEALRIFNDTVRKVGDRYEVTWPWKENDYTLPDNFAVALRRLKSLYRRLQGMPEVLTRYDGVIKEQLRLGIVEKMDIKQVDGPRLYYIPHHCVIKDTSATTKLRVVYDASSSASSDCESLNDCLYRGPVLLQDLCGLLCRFRLKPIVMVSDVEKAFLQVGLQVPDREVTRFLWVDNLSKPSVESNLSVYRFRRVPFGVISSPFLLGATINYHLTQCGGSIAEDIKANTYVDNIFGFSMSVEEACEYYTEAKRLFRSASMNLREWMSNSTELMNFIPEIDRAAGPDLKILGIRWNVDHDSIRIRGPTDDSGIQWSKRTIMQFASRVFDPLGLLNPVMIRAKLIIQDLWKLKSPWDKEIGTELKERWLAIVNDIKALSRVNLNRFIGSRRDSGDVQLHCFCDASSKAYGACGCLRVEDPTATATSNLLLCKARLAPIEPLTLPRLELMAVLVGVRLATFLRKEMRCAIARIVVWSDSKCVLHWINSKKLFPVFVENRLKEIRKCTDSEFRYVSTDQNPADHPRRGLSLVELERSDAWWRGPPWLCAAEDSWPKVMLVKTNQNEEIVDSAEVVAEVSATVSIVSVDSECSFLGIDLKGFSSLTRLVRVTAWMLRFIDKARGKSIIFGSLTAQEIAVSTNHWVSLVQKTWFVHIIEAVKNRNCPKELAQMIRQLRLYLDSDGLLRCRGRLEWTQLNECEKFPALLPKHSHFTRLVIDKCHKQLGHVGVKHTLAQVRRHYWIPQGKSAVQCVLRRCVVCKKWDGGHYSLPQMPPLPSSRFQQCPAFTYTGVDFIGPLVLRESSDYTKAWLCMFACGVTRAIHLEVARGLTTTDFIMCLRRFVARRGKPKMVISDKAPSFRQAKGILGKMWKSTATDFLVSEGIEWKFIPAFSPWMGGFYERLIGSVKRSLRKLIGRRYITYSELVTLSTEVESIVNTRPLVYLENEETDDFILTPGHFLGTNLNKVFPDVSAANIDPDFTITKIALRKSS